MTRLFKCLLVRVVLCVCGYFVVGVGVCLFVCSHGWLCVCLCVCLLACLLAGVRIRPIACVCLFGCAFACVCLFGWLVD